MDRRRLLPVIAVAAVALLAVGYWLLRRADERYYTGFVEGEERVLRSEVAGRVLEVAFAEGDAGAAERVVARIDDADVASRIRSKQQELEVLDAQIARQEEEITLLESTWSRDVGAQQAELARGESEARARRAQLQARGRLVEERRQHRPAARRRARAPRPGEQRARACARAARARRGPGGDDRGGAAPARDPAPAARARARAARRARGAAREVHDPRAGRADRRAEPAAVAGRARAAGHADPLGARSRATSTCRSTCPSPTPTACASARGSRSSSTAHPGRRVPGEVSFVADQANFTPEKIETRSDRARAGLPREGADPRGRRALPPGTEGNVYLLDDDGETAVRDARVGA